MTIDQLRNLPGYEGLQNDLRFRSLMAHLLKYTEAPATADGSWFRGREAIIQQIDRTFAKAAVNPAPPGEEDTKQQYKGPKHRKNELTAT